MVIIIIVLDETVAELSNCCDMSGTNIYTYCFFVSIIHVCLGNEENNSAENSDTIGTVAMYYE